MPDETGDPIEVASDHGSSSLLDDTMIDASAADGTPALGARIGRYVVLSRLGAGAMGVVLAAYDPVLDRKVALKLLKGLVGDSSKARIRLRREAQALAKLDHRNVVTVHDVGVHEGQLFVSMEFVEGRTLGAWIAERDQTRPWKEVLRVFVDAGRGLAAAHDAGLVHRDFKPDNVMLGNDGRVRVMDFGLARAQDEHELEAPEREPSITETLGLRIGNRILDDELTQTGTMMGTPAYMALEQLRGQPADARSDQFGYCVALYQALYGQRPFAAGNLSELVEVLERGELRAPSEAADVPAWLRKIVVRGLSRQPDERWPSMHELLAALADDPSARRRQRGAIGLLGALSLAAVIGVAIAPERSEPELCVGMDAKLAGVWDDQRRAAVEAAFTATELSYASSSWTRVARVLDDYADAWALARREACLATQRGEQSGQLLDRRMACLDRRLEHLDASVGVLASADAKVVEEAVSLVSKLPSLARCADLDALALEHPPPDREEVATAVAALTRRLADAKALENAGKYERGLALASEVVAEAETLDYAPLLARAYLRQGSLQERAGDYELAEATLTRAYDHAVSERMVDEAAHSAAKLTFIVGYRLGRYDDAARWTLDADPFARAQGSDDVLARLLDLRGLVAEAAGHHDEAQALLERGLELKQRSVGAEHVAVAFSYNNLGNVAHSTGDYEQANHDYERAHALWTSLLGPEHPMVATVLNNLGNVATSKGDYEQARDYHERALELREAALGPRHPLVAASLHNLGEIANQQADYARALDDFERALALKRETLGPEHPDLAYTILSLGDVALELGQLDEARAYFERARALFTSSLGPEHTNVLAVVLGLAEVALSAGELDEARAHTRAALTGLEQALGAEHPYVGMGLIVRGEIERAEGHADAACGDLERGLAIVETGMGAEHPMVAEAATQLGLARLEAGRVNEAIAPLERALAIRSAGVGGRGDVGETRFGLARALWDAGEGRDRARALELGRLAREDLVASERVDETDLAELDAWLEERADGRVVD